jgi:heptosyltransferase-2
VEPFERIVVRMPNWIGDVVMATPLVRTLRENLPRAHLAVLVLPSGAKVLEGSAGIDQVIVYDRKGKDAGFGGMRRVAARLKQERFDLAVCCPNSFSQALILRMAGIPRRAGWSYGGRGFLLTDKLAPQMDGHRRVARPMPLYYLDIARLLGCEVLSAAAHLGTTEQDERDADEFLDRKSVPRDTPLLGLNVGAAFGPSKHWTPRGFADVAAGLRMSDGLRPVVLCGPGEEDLGRTIEDAVGGDIVRTSNDVISLGGLKALIRRLKLLVTTDTGPRHFAVAFDVPHVCVMGSTNPQMTDQPHARGEVVRVDPLLDCMPCHEKVCPLGHHDCLEKLEAAPVLAAAQRVMALPPVTDAAPPLRGEGGS